MPITAHGRTRLFGAALLMFAASAATLLFRSQQASSQPAPEGANACPISFAQQLKSVKAFSEMLPVFRHPRCRNCHGGLDITSEQHPGADQIDRANDPRTPMNPEQRERVSSEQCTACHDNIERKHDSGKGGWMLPPPPMYFVNEDGSDKSDEELCRQMKAMENSADKFVSHIEDDHGTIQFIKAGFEGDRALGEGLKDYGENGLEREPPPGTQAELTEKAKKWAKAIGEGYGASPDCGCVKPDVELEMKSDLKGMVQGSALTALVTATVKLDHDDTELRYHGKAPLVHGTYTMSAPACQATFAPSGGDLDVKEVLFDVPDEGPMTIKLAVQPTNSGGFMTLHCPRIPPTNLPVIPFAQEWRFVHEPDRSEMHYRFDQFDVPKGGGGGRELVGSKDVTRKKDQQGITVTATTRFELWSVPRK